MNRNNFIYIFCILILLGISGYVYNSSKELSCGQCTVEFNTKTVTEKQFNSAGEYRIDELFETYRDEDKCLITWNAVNGFERNYG